MEDKIIKTAKPLQVLVIDDDNDVVHLLERMIPEFLRCNIDISQDGVQAVHCCTKKSYDIIFTDYFMPHLNGHEFVEYLRSTPNPNQETTVILITQAHKEINMEEEFGNEVRLLKKPINPFQLRLSLSSVLHKNDGTIPLISEI